MGFFEFDKGVRTVRHLADTPDSEAWSVNLCANFDECRKGVLIELFGTTYIAAMVFDNLKLPRHQGTIWQKRKFLPFQKKYFSIPSGKLFYYPAAPDTPETLAEEKANEDDETATVTADQQE